MAANLRFVNQLKTAPDLSSLEEIAPRESWTEDALMALNGLLKELELDALDTKAVPGFIGPDNFYVS